MDNIKHYKNVKDIQRNPALRERLMFPLSQPNYQMNGVLFPSLLLIMSYTNAGKSLLSRMVVESTIKQGYKVFAMWGEEDEEEATDRLYSQHIPYEKENYKYEVYQQNGKDTNCGEYRLSDEKYNKAKEDFSDNLFIYDNSYVPTKENIISEMEKARVNEGCRVFLLDNLEILDFDNDNENAGVKQIMIAIRRWAIKNKCIVILLSHIRKIERDVVAPDIFDNKGTSSVTNVCRNILVLVRKDMINEQAKGFKPFKQWVEKEGYSYEDADGFILVRKQKGNCNGLTAIKFNKYTGSYYACEKSDKKPELISLGEDEELPF